MTHTRILQLLATVPLLTAIGCGGTPQGDTQTPGAQSSAAKTASSPAAPVQLGESKALGGIAVKPPTAWVESPPSSNMRRAQWTVGAGDAAAEMVVYYFGNTGAGSLQANLDRWFGQFEQPDGRASKDVAQISESQVAGMTITQVDVGGRFVAQVRPGAEERRDEPDWHMLAAIVAAPDGAYYFKMVGPRATVTTERDGFAAMLQSISKADGHPSGHPATSPHPQ